MNFALIKIFKNKLEVFSDALGFKDIFYDKNSGFVSDQLMYYPKINPDFELNEQAVKEFLFSSTTVNFKSVIKDVSILPLQTKLIIKKNEVPKLLNNNFLKYKSVYTDENIASKLLANAMKVSGRDIGSKAKYHLLSSGLDSRGILAACPNLICLTAPPTGKRDDPVYALAGMVCNILGCEHERIEYSSEKYLEFAPEAAVMTNCRTTFRHRHFEKLKKGRIGHGTAFDSLIRGYVRNTKYLSKRYLPFKIIKKRGRGIPFPIENSYENIEGIILYKFVPNDMIKQYPEFAKNYLEEVRKEIRSYYRLSRDPRNLLDMFWLSNFFPRGLEDFLDYDNKCSSSFFAAHPAIVNWHFSVPSIFRFGRIIEIKAVKQINEKILKVRTENSFFRLTENSWVNALSKLRTFISPEKVWDYIDYLYFDKCNKMIQKLWDKYGSEVPLPFSITQNISCKETLLNFLLWIKGLKTISKN